MPNNVIHTSSENISNEHYLALCGTQGTLSSILLEPQAVMMKHQCACPDRNARRMKNIHGVGSNPRQHVQELHESRVIPSGGRIPEHTYCFESCSNHDSSNVTWSATKPERNVPHGRNGSETMFMSYHGSNMASS